MDGWNTSFLLGWPIFRCYVSFRECREKKITENPKKLTWIPGGPQDDGPWKGYLDP